MFPARRFRQRTCIAQGLGNVVLGETWTYSCLQFNSFHLVIVIFKKIGLFFFLKSVSLSYFNPHLLLIFETFWLCVLRWFQISLIAISSQYMCEWVSWDFLYIYLSICVYRIHIVSTLIRLYHPSFPTSLLNLTLCLRTTVVSNFLLVDQH